MKTIDIWPFKTIEEHNQHRLRFPTNATLWPGRQGQEPTSETEPPVQDEPAQGGDWRDEHFWGCGY